MHKAGQKVILLKNGEKIMNQAYFNWCLLFSLNSLSFPPPTSLSFLPPNYSSQAPAVLWSRAPFFRYLTISLVPHTARILTVLLHCWLIDDVNLEKTVPPAANFFKMFSSLILKILSECFKRKSPWRAPPAWFLNLLRDWQCWRTVKQMN